MTVSRDIRSLGAWSTEGVDTVCPHARRFTAVHRGEPTRRRRAGDVGARGMSARGTAKARGRDGRELDDASTGRAPPPARTYAREEVRESDGCEGRANLVIVDGGVFDRRSRFAAMLGSGEVLKGLELGLYDMCIGERRVLRVPPALAFGDRGSRAFGVPGGATLEYDVTLRGINLQYDPAVRREDLDFEQRF